MRIVRREGLGHLLSPIENRKAPVHRWFYYREGFSKDLVEFFLDRFNPHFLLDPFVGSGTTVLVAKERGIPSIGLDVLPVALLASRAKTYDYDKERVKGLIREAMEIKPGRSECRVRDGFLRKVLERDLETACWYREWIEEVEDYKVRDLLLLALMNAVGRSAGIEKRGAGLRYRGGRTVPIIRSFRRELRRILEDLPYQPSGRAETRIVEADARAMPLEDESVEVIITSPPYLNRVNYLESYRLEMALLFPGRRPPLFHSFVGELPRKGVLQVLELYKKDMEKFLEEAERVLMRGGRAAVVVENTYLRDVDVGFETDVFVAEAAESLGMDSEVWIARVERGGGMVVRESIVLLKKG